ncbi:MAG: oligosaccharide flippase family protein [Lachnospiraceae bacterium]|nr:oligosaccharide flippase family protein [Lachnospiraceae bacterium]
MSRAKDLIKNTSILLIAKISTQVINFLLLPLYTSLLTTEQYGEVDVYTSLVMIIVPLITLQLEMAIFRFYITEKGEQEKSDIVTSGYSIVFMITIIVSSAYFVSTLVADINYRLLVFLYYLTQVWSAMLLQTCRAKGDNISYGIGTLLNSSLAVMFNVVFIAFLGWKVEGILISYVIAQTVGCLYMIARIKVHKILHKGKLDLIKCKELLSYSIPLVFNQIASWAINYSDRLIILAFWGQGINGIYSVANKFSNVASTFFGVYNIAWTENVIRSLDDKEARRYVSKVFEITFSLYLMIVIGVINLLPFFFDWLVNISFRDAYNHVPILLVAMLFSGMAANIGSLYIAYKRTREVGVTTALAGVCNVGVHFVLLNFVRLYAASVSTLVSFVVLFIYRFIFAKKFFDLQVNIKAITFQLVILIYSCVAYIIDEPLLILTGLVLNLSYVCKFIYSNRNQIRLMIKER